MKLYEIHEALERLFCIWEQTETDEERAVLEGEIEALELALGDKVDSCVSYYKGQLAEAEAIKAEAKKLQERARKYESRAEWLKRYIGQVIPHGEKWQNERHQLGWRKSSSVEIVDESLIPIELSRVVTSPDKAAIKDQLSRGVEVPGARIKESLNLQIK
jgi:hypothetical protein